MPGPFEIAYLYPSYDGGKDLWLGGRYNERGQWFSVWHCMLENWWGAGDDSWTSSGGRDGWTFYPVVPFWLLTRSEWHYASSTDYYDWGEFLDAGGPANWDELPTWTACVRASGKGTNEGKGKGKTDGKGKGKTDGKGKGKAKGKAKGKGKGKSKGKGKGKGKGNGKD
jgi:hypothetical protein